MPAVTPAVPPDATGGAHPAVASTPATSWSTLGLPPPTGRPARRRKAWLDAAVAVGVAAVIVAGLLWTGILPLGRPGPNLAVPFSFARSAALNSVSTLAGGPWGVVAAIGMDERTATNVSMSNASALLGANCTLERLAGVQANASLEVPQYGGSFGSGLAPFWLVVLANQTRATFVAVEVRDRTAEPLATIHGPGCLAAGTSASELPSGTVDSPAVAGSAWSLVGQGYVTVDPNLTSLLMAAFPSGSFAGATYPGMWAIFYAPCNPLLGGSTPEVGFVASLGLTTGAFSLAVAHNVTCPP